MAQTKKIEEINALAYGKRDDGTPQYIAYKQNGDCYVMPVRQWELSKCFVDEVRNTIQLNYGNKSISILITDDLYQEIQKMLNTKEKE